MSMRTLLSVKRLTLAAVVAAAAASAAGPAAAYVVVTSDNRVYDVATKPEIRGDLVVFELDGEAVSLRIYEVNITKSNELNYLLDSGAGAPTLTAQLRALKPGTPTDERIIASSRLHQVEADRALPEYRVRLEGQEPPGPPPQEGGRGPRAARPSTDFDRRSNFEKQAREALDEADRQVRSPPPSRPAASAPMDTGRASDLDAEIAEEQARLKRLTAGEEPVDDLERAIDASMDTIRKLQKRRDRMGGSSASTGGSAEAAPARAPSGSFPAGSREAKWEREMADLQAKLQRLQSQQAGLTAEDASEREMLDEVIGETEYRIERLQRRIDGR